MPRPEIKNLNRRYADIVRQLEGQRVGGRSHLHPVRSTKDELLAEKGKIEHWLWVLESEE